VRTQTAVAEPTTGAYAVPERRPLPLEGVRVTAEISGAASRVVMAQRYRNAEAVPVEAVYVFPLPEGAALCGLVIETGGRRINGRVLEREEAFAAYDDALAAGHGAALLDEERPNVFTASVGNLLPGQELTVELTWVETLAREGEAIRFALPTVVAPRYVPNEDARGVSPTPGERVSPPVKLGVPYGFSFAAEVELPGGVAGVESPTHPIRVLLADGKARVELAQGAAAMDRDLVLLLTPVAAAKPCGRLERQVDGSVVAAVSFVPLLKSSGGPREVVFLVDRSGSMNGDSIEAVRRALQLCLRSLEEGDAFDIVGFGSTFQTLFGAPRPYAQASLEEASAHVERLQADLGGTEILPALRAVLERPSASGLRREVVLLTDGEVSNDDAVVALAREHAATTRVFAFGIGHAASEHLVRAVARASGGAAEMILPGRALEATVVRQFGRLRAAALEDVRVAWSGAKAQLQAPATVAQLFDGEPLAVYAWLDGAPAAALLSATSAGKAVSWEVELDPARVADGSLLGTLAARAAIRDLEEGTAEGRRGSNQRDRADTRVREAIVRLAVRYGLASRETSFVAVEEREAGEDRPVAELRRIPVALAHGWGGVEATRHEAYLAGIVQTLGSGHDVATMGSFELCDLSLESAGDVAMPRASGKAAQRAQSPGDASFSRRASAQESVPPYLLRRSGSPAEEPAPPAGRPRDARRWATEAGGDAPLSAPPATRRHDAVVRLQRADGSWHLDGRLLGVLGVEQDRLVELAATAGGGAQGEAIVATLAAVAFLEAHASQHRDEWSSLAAKATRWAEAALASLGMGGAFDPLSHAVGLLV
jgi:Ca-activated chloride channel family protein